MLFGDLPAKKAPEVLLQSPVVRMQPNPRPYLTFLLPGKGTDAAAINSFQVCD